jgi:hypothetical protein
MRAASIIRTMTDDLEVIIVSCMKHASKPDIKLQGRARINKIYLF